MAYFEEKPGLIKKRKEESNNDSNGHRGKIYASKQDKQFPANLETKLIPNE